MAVAADMAAVAAGTAEAAADMAAVGTAVVDMLVQAGTATADMVVVAGTAVAAGTKPLVGKAAEVATTMADISAGTSTGRVIPDGEKVSPRPNSGVAGAGQDLSVSVPAGGIGAAPGVGAMLVGDGAQVLGHGAACWSAPRLAWSSLLPLLSRRRRSMLRRLRSLSPFLQ